MSGRERERSGAAGAAPRPSDDGFAEAIARGLEGALPPSSAAALDPSVPHAPPRRAVLDEREQRLALSNALRYLPPAWHDELAGELAEELTREGRVLMRRLRPSYAMHARPIDAYPARCPEAAAIMLMITNNLDPAVAQYPHELVTYGGNGAVFQNWAQYALTMRYLSRLERDQTLVLYSGHPLGVFPSHPDAPRVVVTNGMVIPAFSTVDDYERLNALGVTSYGQMTAGSFMYIGPQGIVHGTTITLMNAGRLYLGSGDEGLRGKLYVTSGLGGMSGAQAKAAVIAGAVGVVAEADPAATKKRHEQGWVDEVEHDLERLVARVERARAAGEAVSIAYQGNVVDLWEHLVENDVAVELGSDQTSLHNPYGGGYWPAGVPFERARRMVAEDPAGFRDAVQASLRRHAAAVIELSRRGMHFWDYGNAFLLEASRAGVPITRDDGSFIFPSYVEDIMGPICFDHGFGPFRWVVTSGSDEDLACSDAIAAEVLRGMAAEAPDETRQQITDNLRWIEQAQQHGMVVGSRARILYADAAGRIGIARAFNAAIAAGEISAPIVLGRDHHDVSGTDSPYRETANIRDGSSHCADMAVHNVIGDAFRGATWVSLHNGGGVGWGQVVNGGFGLVLDGSDDAERRLRMMLHWDVNNGVARRAWAGNAGARYSIEQAMADEPRLEVTLASAADPELVQSALAASASGGNVSESLAKQGKQPR